MKALRTALAQCAGVMLSALATACAHHGSRSGTSAQAEKPGSDPSAASSPNPIRPWTAAPSMPLVTLDGKTHPLSVTVVSSGPRVYSRALTTWISEKPSMTARHIGYFRAGDSSPTSARPAGTSDCPGGWYPVVPRGYVCVGATATLDKNDPIVRATEEYPPDPTRKLPYIYGSVRRPGPVYDRLPTRAELEKTEPGIDERMQKWLTEPGEIGASYAEDVWLGHPGAVPDPATAWKTEQSDPLPEFLQNGRATPDMFGHPREPGALVIDHMKPKLGYSILRTFLFQGRRYALTGQLEIVPTDRLRPIRGSDFHGFQIPKDIDFPFAIVREPDAHYWMLKRGRLVDAGSAPYRAAVKLTGKQEFFHKRLHYQTVDGKWLSDMDASRLDPARRMPAWGKRGEKWIDVNLTKQTLVLYDGTKAVYATLISSGEAGLEDPKHTTATKRGIFRIHTKHITATMSSDELGESFELRDVPYVEYFDKEGYALHGAYWHDRFGIPRSHGCINLSPEDARRIFYWTDPQLPTGWHGVLQPLTGTVLFVHP
jgi:L,D-transpeptidase catalytic domain